MLNGHVSVVEELKRIVLSDAYEDVLHFDCLDGNGHTPMNKALTKRNYGMIKLLYNSKEDNSRRINQMLEICLYSKDEYDETDEIQCHNYKFFSKLLASRKGIKGEMAMRYCLACNKIDYFELLLSVNDTIEHPFACADVWYWVCFIFYVFRIFSFFFFFFLSSFFVSHIWIV